MNISTPMRNLKVNIISKKVDYRAEFVMVYSKMGHLREPHALWSSTIESSGVIPDLLADFQRPRQTQSTTSRATVMAMNEYMAAVTGSVMSDQGCDDTCHTMI